MLRCQPLSLRNKLKHGDSGTLQPFVNRTVKIQEQQRQQLSDMLQSNGFGGWVDPSRILFLCFLTGQVQKKKSYNLSEP